MKKGEGGEKEEEENQTNQQDGFKEDSTENEVGKQTNNNGEEPMKDTN